MTPDTHGWASFIAPLLISGLCTGGLFALVAIGYSLVYGVLRFINVAHGDLFATGAYVAYVIHTAGLSLTVSLVAAGLTCAVISGLTQRYVYRPLDGQPSILLLVTSVGVSVIIRSALSLLFGDAVLSSRGSITPTMWSLGNVRIEAAQVAIICAALCSWAVLHLVVFRTTFGLQLRATASDRHAASARGVATTQVITWTFLISGLYAGVAGALGGVVIDLKPTMGTLFGLKAFTASVLGGVGSLTGTMLAGFVVGLVDAGVAGLIGTQYRDGVVIGFLVVVLLFRPSGLASRSRGGVGNVLS